MDRNDFCKSQNAGIDVCIKAAVDYLNEHGYQTVASCCGHGHQPARISLKSGMEILLLNYDQAQRVSALFPDINGESR